MTASDTDTVDAARDTIATAITLGVPLPVTPGMTFWMAFVTLEHGDSDFYLGPCPTKDDILSLLREWVVNEWDNVSWGPWEEGDDAAAARQAWLTEHTDEEIVNSYFEGTDADTFSILDGSVVAGSPRPNVWP